jgi:hypothetical protein
VTAAGGSNVLGGCGCLLQQWQQCVAAAAADGCSSNAVLAGGRGRVVAAAEASALWTAAVCVHLYVGPLSPLSIHPSGRDDMNHDMRDDIMGCHDMLM